jgi:protein TonB
VTKQLLRVSAALLLSVTSACGWAQTKDNPIRMPKPLSCEKPVWNTEAVRYELEGDTVVKFDLDEDGRPLNPRTARSSGWTLLDTMSERAVSTCRYAPPTDPAAMRTGLLVNFDWKLAPHRQTTVSASLVAGSCPASERFADFRPLTGSVRGSEGVLVRFLLDAAGKPFSVHIEGNRSPEVYKDAVAYLGACRFTPETTSSVPGLGNMVGRLIPKEA